MRARTASRLAWSLLASNVAATFTFLFLMYLNSDVGDVIGVLPILVAFTAFATIGALLISRYPRHPIGWIFMTIGLGTALGNLTQQYAIYSLFTRSASPLPASVAAAWFGNWSWLASVGVFVFVPLLLPNGRPLSPRWRSAVWAAGAALGAIVTGIAFKPGPLDLGEEHPIANPLGIPGLSGAWLDVIGSVTAIAYLLVLAIGPIGLVVRAHRSRGEERQQLKWLGYTAALAVVLWVLQPLDPGDFLSGIALAVLPCGTGIAILRYRLYDLDLVINRTLVYASLTAVLAFVYVAGVVGVGGVVRQMTGQEGNSLVVAASTLAVAGLFRPARARLQAFIDRRFYRRKYNAAQALEAFTARLREEVDLDALTSDLLTVIGETVQPVHASLWLRATQEQPQSGEFSQLFAQ